RCPCWSSIGRRSGDRFRPARPRPARWWCGASKWGAYPPDGIGDGVGTPRACPALGTVETATMTSDLPEQSAPIGAAAVWIVEDKPAAAALAAGLWGLNGTPAYLYRDGQLSLDA